MAREIATARESNANPINAMGGGRNKVMPSDAEDRAMINRQVREFQSEADDILYNTLSAIGREDLYGKDIKLAADYDRDSDEFSYYLIERGQNGIKFDVDGSMAPLEDAIWEIARRH